MKQSRFQKNKKGSGFQLALGLSLFLTIIFLEARIPIARALDTESPAIATSPSPIAAPLSPMTAAEAKQMTMEFQRAQNSALKALEHRYKLEIKELKASHSARQKEWDRKEKEARHKFFAEYTRGPDRRSYIKDFLERQKNFHQLLSDEKRTRSQEQDVRYKSVKEDHLARLKEFHESIKRGERPAPALWPAN